MLCSRAAIVITCLLFFINCCQGHYYTVPYYEWSSPRPFTRQFTQWWPSSWWSQQVAKVSTGQCNSTLRDYNAAYDARPSSHLGRQLLSICYQHEACILDNVGADIVANFQSANVILGLMPTLLSLIGPSASEIAILSAHRPVLSLFVSLGAPALYQSRVLELFDSRSVLSTPLENDIEKLLCRHKGRPWLVLLSILEYILALGSIASNLLISIQIGQKTILAWACTTQFVSLLWTLLPSVICGTAIVCFALTKADTKELASGSAAASANHQTHSPSPGARLKQKLYLEFMPCLVHDCRCLGEQRIASAMATILNLLVGAFSFAHVTFGIMLFSSLQLMSVSDALNNVLWRYIISTAVCRVIVIVELVGVKDHNRRNAPRT